MWGKVLWEALEEKHVWALVSLELHAVTPNLAVAVRGVPIDAVEVHLREREGGHP